jgi:GGDEF domain-containing protein
MQMENPRSSERCLKRQPKKMLQSHLSSNLRSEDNELNKILGALEDISKMADSKVRDADAVRNALRRAAGSAVKQALLDRQLREMAITDDLTGLYNRRGFWASATHQLKVGHRNGQDLLLLFCDVEDLKKINDAYGHVEGGLALVRVAGAPIDAVAGQRFSALKARRGVQGGLKKGCSNPERRCPFLNAIVNVTVA